MPLSFATNRPPRRYIGRFGSRAQEERVSGGGSSGPSGSNRELVGPSTFPEPTPPGLGMEMPALTKADRVGMLSDIPPSSATDPQFNWAGDTFTTGGISYDSVTDFLRLNEQGGVDFDEEGQPLGWHPFAPEGYERPEGSLGRIVVQGPGGPRVISGIGITIEDVINALGAGEMGGTFVGDASTNWNVSTGRASQEGIPYYEQIRPEDLYKGFQVAPEEGPPLELPGDIGNDTPYQISDADQAIIDAYQADAQRNAGTIADLGRRLDEMGEGQDKDDQLAAILMAMQMNPGLQGGSYGGGGGYGYGSYGNAAQYGYV